MAFGLLPCAQLCPLSQAMGWGGTPSDCRPPLLLNSQTGSQQVSPTSTHLPRQLSFILCQTRSTATYSVPLTTKAKDRQNQHRPILSLLGQSYRNPANSLRNSEYLLSVLSEDQCRCLGWSDCNLLHLGKAFLQVTDSCMSSVCCSMVDGIKG